jgi:hypothetical protein
MKGLDKTRIDKEPPQAPYVTPTGFLRDISRSVAKYFDLPVERIYETPSDIRKVSTARKVAIAIALQEKGLSRSRIASFFGRDPSQIKAMGGDIDLRDYEDIGL